jgi:hypothetical protein
MEMKQKRIELWQKRLQEWRESGKSGPVWSKEQGIAYPTFCYWRGKLLNSEQRIKSFVELVEEPRIRSGVVLEWQGISVHLVDDFDISTLKRFLQALQELGC